MAETIGTKVGKKRGTYREYVRRQGKRAEVVCPSPEKQSTYVKRSALTGGRAHERVRLIYIGKPCPLCGQWIDVLSWVHTEGKHGMDRAEFAAKYFPECFTKEFHTEKFKKGRYM